MKVDLNGLSNNYFLLFTRKTVTTTERRVSSMNYFF